jgi:hypothetical protein
MAEISYSIPVEGMSGRIGNSQIVMFRTRTGNFARAFTQPANPQTADQAAVRAFLAASSKQWTLLTEVQRTAWEEYAEAFFSEEVNGSLVAPSAAPTGGPPPGISAAAQGSGAAANEFTYEVTHSIAIVTNYRLLLKITPGSPPGETPQGRDLRMVRGVTANSFAALPASGNEVDFVPARFSIANGLEYKAELTVVSPEFVPSLAFASDYFHAVA